MGRSTPVEFGNSVTDMTLREFLQANESSIGANGASWDSCDALNQINKTRASFYDIGDWEGNNEFIAVNCHSGKIFLPWFASKIVAAFRCKGLVKIADSEHYSLVSHRHCGSSVHVVDDNLYSPTPIPNQFFGALQFKAMDSEDAGVVIKASYHTNNGSLINDTITLEEDQIQYSTNFQVVTVKALSKPSTSGLILVSDCACKPLFYMHPYSTSLRYRTYCISGGCCDHTGLLTLKVKKAYYPFSSLHYDHLIDFPDHALSLGMEAIAARAQRTTDGIAVYERLYRNAVLFLKKQKETSNDTVLEPATNAENEVSLVEDVTYGDC